MEQDHAMSEYGILAKVQLWETYRNPGNVCCIFGDERLSTYTVIHRSHYTNPYQPTSMSWFMSLTDFHHCSTGKLNHDLLIHMHEWRLRWKHTTPYVDGFSDSRFVFAKWFIWVETSRFSTIWFICPQIFILIIAQNLRLEICFKMASLLMKPCCLFSNWIWTKTLKSFEDADGPAGAGMGQYPQAQAEYGIFDWQDSVLGCFFFYRNPQMWWIYLRKFQVGPLDPKPERLVWKSRIILWYFWGVIGDLF